MAKSLKTFEVPCMSCLSSLLSLLYIVALQYFWLPIWCAWAWPPIGLTGPWGFCLAESVLPEQLRIGPISTFEIWYQPQHLARLAAFSTMSCWPVNNTINAWFHYIFLSWSARSQPSLYCHSGHSVIVLVCESHIVHAKKIPLEILFCSQVDCHEHWIQQSFQIAPHLQLAYEVQLNVICGNQTWPWTCMRLQCGCVNHLAQN